MFLSVHIMHRLNPMLGTKLEFFLVIIYGVGAGITTLMSISDGLNPCFFRRKMEKTRSMKKNGRRGVCFPHFFFIDIMIKVFSLFLP